MGKLTFTPPVNRPIKDIYGTERKRWNKKIGKMEKYNHSGIDYKAEEDTRVEASEDGRVIRASFNKGGGYGNVIVIYHNPGKPAFDNIKNKHLYTLYAHLHKMYVTPGDYVEKYEAIGLSGNTGHSTGPHLHFEVIEASTELGWNTEGNMGVPGGGSIRKNPENYFNQDRSIEGTLPDIVERAIMERVEFVPDIDLERKDPFRMQAWLDGKYLGYVNKYTGSIEANIEYDLEKELGRIWRKSLRVPESRPIELEYKIELQ